MLTPEHAAAARRAGELVGEAFAVVVEAIVSQPKGAPEVRFLTVSEICERWSTGETLVRGLIRKGTLAAVRMGDAVRVPLASIEAYERRNTKGPT